MSPSEFGGHATTADTGVVPATLTGMGLSVETVVA